MAKVPGPRKGNQPGIGGHGKNYHKAQKFDAANPGKSKGCAVAALGLLAIPAGLVSLLGYGVWQVFS